VRFHAGHKHLKVHFRNGLPEERDAMKQIPVKNSIAPHELDMMLAHGYYRMQQSFFSTDFIQTDAGAPARVIWARVCLGHFKANRRLLTLQKRNRNFELSLHPAHITEEIEQLYARYIRHIDFESWPPVAQCLLCEALHEHFPGHMWMVRDRGRLIATGYFDEGLKSCAGILNFYDPEYAQYSLGLWLYLEGLRYAAETGKHYFYPGYIVVGFPKFDYKLLAGREKIELYERASEQWIPFGKTFLSPNKAIV